VAVKLPASALLASTEFTLSFRRAQPAGGNNRSAGGGLYRSLSGAEGSEVEGSVEKCSMGGRTTMPYLYILECSDGTYYTGSTIDLHKRLWQHKNGLGANHTKKRLPVKLVYLEVYERIVNAYFREKQIQGWTHAKKQALIKKNYDEIHKLAECQNVSHFLNI
jgi:putative endonuclease